MASTLFLPDIPDMPILIDEIMPMQWQNFFIDLLVRTGGSEALTNLELYDEITDITSTLVANRLVATNADIELESIDLVDWVSGTANQITVTDDGDGKITLSEIPFQQTVTVAKSGGDFDVIQDAIDSITDATDTKRYAVLIYPGDYTETIIGKDFVELMGMTAREAVNITGATGPLYTFPDDEGHIFNLKFSLSPTTANQNILDVPATVNARQVISNCLFEWTTASDINASVFDINGGEAEFINCKVIFSNTNVAGGAIRTQRIWDVDGNAIIDLIGNIIDVDIYDINNRILIYDDASLLGGDTHIKDNIVHVTSNNAGAYSGIVRFITYTGVTATLHVSDNSVELTSLEAGGTGQADFIRLNSVGTGIAMSTANHVVITGFATNYWANVAAGDTVISNLDDITAADDWTGAGTVEYASSLSDGIFNVSDRVGIGTTAPDTALHVNVDNATSVIRLERTQDVITSADIVGRLEVETQDLTDPGICAKIEALSYGTSCETGWRFSCGTPSALVEYMQIDPYGFVGIGTPWPDSPDALLHIQHITDAYFRLTRKDTTVSADDIIGRIEFETQDADNAGVAAYMQAIAEGTAGEVGLAFGTGDRLTITERLRIDHDGTIIIGAGDAGVDHILKFDGETSDGILTWMEDEATWQFARTKVSADADVIFDFQDKRGGSLIKCVLNSNLYTQIYFNDNENTKIGFSTTDPTYFAFMNDETEIWLGNAADPALYFNYYVGSGEQHGKADNLQDVYYYINSNFRVGDIDGGNFLQVDENGDTHHVGTAGFYPRRIAQSAFPAAGTGATQIDTGELIVMEDTDDGRVYLFYNDATSGILSVELT